MQSPLGGTSGKRCCSLEENVQQSSLIHLPNSSRNTWQTHRNFTCSLDVRGGLHFGTECRNHRILPRRTAHLNGNPDLPSLAAAQIRRSPGAAERCRYPHFLLIHLSVGSDSDPRASFVSCSAGFWNSLSRLRSHSLHPCAASIPLSGGLELQSCRDCRCGVFRSSDLVASVCAWFAHHFTARGEAFARRRNSDHGCAVWCLV